MKTLFDLIMISGVVLGLAFILATQFSKNRKDKTIICLNFVIAFLLLNNLHAFLFETVLVDAPFFIRRKQIPWYMLIMPSYIAFLIYYLKIKHKTQSYIIPSLLLFSIEIFIRFTLYPFYYNKENSTFIGKYVQLEEIINAVYFIFLYIKSIIILFNYTNLYQPILSFDNLKWLKNFTFLGGIVILMWVCAIILNLESYVNPEIHIYYPLRISSTLLLYWIGYQGFYNYSLMTERIELRKIIKEEESLKSENSGNNRSDDDKFKAIKEYIEKNKRFIDPSLSLEKLASEMEISTSTLSHVINQESGQNFSDFINCLRVRKAKKYLTKENFSSYTIIAIGLECGFNSKSAFYAAFKKFTSLTPTEYKNSKST